MKLHEALHEARVIAGLSQVDLAAKLGKETSGNSFVSVYEAGKRDPSGRIIAAWARATGTTITTDGNAWRGEIKKPKRGESSV